MAMVSVPKPQPQSARPPSQEPHPCIRSALETRSLEDLQEFQGLLREEAEEQKRSIADMLREQHRVVTAEAANRFQHLERLMLEHRDAFAATLDRMAARLVRIEQQSQPATHKPGEDLSKVMERVAARLERQEQRLDEGVQSLLRQSLEQRVGGPQQKEQPWEHPLARLAEGEQHLRESVGRIEELLQASIQRTRRSSRPSEQLPTGFREEGPVDKGGMPGEGERPPTSPASAASLGQRSSPRRQGSSPHEQEENGLGPSRSTSKVSLNAPSEDLGAFVAAQGSKGRNGTLAWEGEGDKAVAGMALCKRRLEQMSTVLIMLNCIWMGVEAEVGMRIVRAGGNMPEWSTAIEMTFALVFLMELIGRLGLYGAGFFKYPQVLWNAFDATVVLVQVIDVFVNMYNVSFARSLRVARLLRAARVLMNVPHTRALRLLMGTVSKSLAPLTWVMLLLTAVIFLCSVAMLQAIRVNLEDQPGSTSAHLELFANYGSLWSTMMALFMAVTGGKPWGKLVEPLVGVSDITIVFMILYVVFVIWGMVNIATAIFVECLMDVALTDDSTQVQESIWRQNSPVNRVRESLLEYANVNGHISLEGLESALSDPAFMRHLKSLHMDAWEATGLFHLLNCDVISRVHIDDYIRGILDMKFQSRRVDTTTLMYENKRIMTRIAAFMRVTEVRFEELVRAISEDRPDGVLRSLGMTHFDPGAEAHPARSQI